MSEDKPNFKVTDRRLFNADGTARDDVREAREAEAAAAAAAAPASADAPAPEAAATAGANAAAASASETAARPAPEPASRPTSADAPGAEAGRGPAPPAAGEDDDPQEFLMVVEFIASFAAESLGMATHPEAGGQAHINLPLARQCIDMLAALERKTRGNLSEEEQQFLTVVLSQLRMHYVQLSKQRPAAAPPRGFTGGDITGGR